jgi:hypothetical protein
LPVSPVSEKRFILAEPAQEGEPPQQARSALLSN